jgi:hypothetical protein
MPTSTLNESKAERTQGRLSASESTLEKRAPATAPKGAAGYGFEFIVVTREQADWPLYLLQWACNAEILNDVGFLQRVDKYQGLTVEEIQVGNDPGDQVNLLVARARAPLPTGTQLPNGRMDILVATVITDEEMNCRDQERSRCPRVARLQAACGELSKGATALASRCCHEEESLRCSRFAQVYAHIGRHDRGPARGAGLRALCCANVFNALLNCARENPYSTSRAQQIELVGHRHPARRATGGLRVL